ncbi:MAG: hypothetical protein HKP59_02665 [Lutibacter sp.]|uniref:hypothetical protein n=1 Tax=Lutibacter sp. TaxID=1925666 RepID=UPI0017F4BB6D|nr:hypothetical protein [Lutibacter sp.]MBT8316508.1 hypothetical protein [Lutibacter sp.]NNJ57368.1 hypothetical protein [Lutibacter sp.]
MNNLIDALRIVEDYNKLSFDQFADILEAYYHKISKNDREEWKFTGLNNTDFLKAKEDSVYLNKNFQ